MEGPNPEAYLCPMLRLDLTDESYLKATGVKRSTILDFFNLDYICHLLWFCVLLFLSLFQIWCFWQQLSNPLPLKICNRLLYCEPKILKSHLKHWNSRPILIILHFYTIVHFTYFRVHLQSINLNLN
jgi:hypothetical protein